MTTQHIPFPRRLRYGIETALVYILYGFFRILPTTVASAAGGALGRLAGKVFPSTKTAYANLDAIMPEKTQSEKDAIVNGMWDNLGRVMAEYAHLHHIMPHVDLVGEEHLRHIKKHGGPAIFFAAHIANWEICSVSIQTYGIDIHPVYRRPNNPGVETLLRNARSTGSTGLIPKGSAGAREMLSVLKDGGTLGIMMDQKLNEGMAVPFFGRDAMTAPAIATFALKFNCPVHPVRIERLGGCHFRVTIMPAIDVTASGDKQADIMRILTNINTHFEDWIRARPEQWLWSHRRWPNIGQK